MFQVYSKLDKTKTNENFPLLKICLKACNVLPQLNYALVDLQKEISAEIFSGLENGKCGSLGNASNCFSLFNSCSPIERNPFINRNSGT